jgi:creatinine amidohydrolase/Fe(II)-dependent formamide hydrolase-like protein
MLLFLRPDLVNQNDLELSKRGASEQWRLFYDNIMVSQEVKDFSESGATGDPTKCDIKKGEQLFKASKEKLDNLVKYLVSLTDDQIASR